MSIFIELRTDANSRKIWEDIANLGVNLTDLGDKVLIYGSLSLCDCFALISTIAQYGEYSATITRKGSP